MARFKYSTPSSSEEARHCGTEGCLWFGKVAHVGPCYNPSVKRGDFHDSPDNRDPRRNPNRRTQADRYVDAIKQSSDG